jgi:hypothetical protein
MELGVRNAGMRATVTAVGWAYCWAVTREAIGHDPSVEEVAGWWNMSRRTAFRDQAAFRKAFPTLDTPAPMYATPESRVGVARHAAAGEKVERWFEERIRRRDADSIKAFMLPVDGTS